MNSSEPLCRIVRFETRDGVPLSGALFEPRRATKRAAIFLHGNGGASVFESGRTNKLARVFTKAGVAWFPFNNRGAHLARRAGPGLGGMAYEVIRDCVPDLDAAIRELRRRGYRDLTLIGHSTGANKVAVYDHYKPRNFVKRYVLLAGGDDTGLLYDQLGPRRFAAALQKARTMIRAKRGEELAPPAVSQLPMSWRSFHDMANPDGDYNVFPFLEVLRGVRLSRKPRFRHVRGIRKPTLVLYGDSDPYLYGDVSRCVGILAEALRAKPNFELAIMGEADHGFGGREGELGRVIVDWIG
ncbi:MAG TPA: alpha/beta fold hydrolase [Thermoanaerobaculia bacterium]|nr:alpha/beta fold hydrolase [Thermoanaerobaculia bacterium]